MHKPILDHESNDISVNMIWNDSTRVKKLNHDKIGNTYTIKSLLTKTLRFEDISGGFINKEIRDTSMNSFNL